jgi:hypothetical protein
MKTDSGNDTAGDSEVNEKLFHSSPLTQQLQRYDLLHLW